MARLQDVEKELRHMREFAQSDSGALHYKVLVWFSQPLLWQRDKWGSYRRVAELTVQLQERVLRPLDRAQRCRHARSLRTPFVCSWPLRRSCVQRRYRI